MKKSILAIVSVAMLGLSACDNGATNKIEAEDSSSATASDVSVSDVTASGTPVFAFNEENHNFGEIAEGTLAEYDFEFTNTGDAPLIINDAKGSCGCTVPNWPKEPIAPGATGKIHVSFNSSGRPGNQQKTVTLKANTIPNTKVLKIASTVIPKAAEEAVEPTTEG